MTGDGNTDAALYMICSFLVRSNAVFTMEEATKMPTSVLMSLIGMLQSSIEREIVRRIVGICAAPSNLIEAIDTALRTRKHTTHPSSS